MAAKQPKAKPQPKATDAQSPDWRTYRALSDCRVGHLRREGEVFSCSAFAECPDYLEEVDGDTYEQDDDQPENTGSAAQGATLADLGLGPAQSVGDVTSADMINQ